MSLLLSEQGEKFALPLREQRREFDPEPVGGRTGGLGDGTADAGYEIVHTTDTENPPSLVGQQKHAGHRGHAP
jgi:hypothetical protein